VYKKMNVTGTFDSGEQPRRLLKDICITSDWMFTRRRSIVHASTANAEGSSPSGLSRPPPSRFFFMRFSPAPIQADLVAIGIIEDKRAASPKASYVAVE